MKYSELKTLASSLADITTSLDCLAARLRKAADSHWQDPQIYTLDKSEVLSFVASEIDDILEAVAAKEELELAHGDENE